MVQHHKDRTVSDLLPEHRATLFPGFGYFDERRGLWRALVHGRVFIDGRPPFSTRLLLRGLKKAMNATPEELSSDMFQQRINGFLTGSGKRRRVVLQIANVVFKLRRRTRRNGSFYGLLNLPKQLEFNPTESVADVKLELRLPADTLQSHSPVVGSIYVFQPTGVSVISDIDDTIKLTGATSKKRMLANTFLKPFEAVAGMADVYQRWQAEGCDFHYVSSSPWELYQPLADMVEEARFPAGSMHLRYFRVRDEMFKRFRPLRRQGKVGIIAGILRRLPHRKFVLIGDSGEMDPEIYRFLARRYPDRISAILIRNLQEKPLSDKRLQKLRSLPAPVKIQIFRDSSELGPLATLYQATN